MEYKISFYANGNVNQRIEITKEGYTKELLEK